MLVTSNKLSQQKFVNLLQKKHNLNKDQTKLLNDIVRILPICKNNYNHYDIDEIESFFVYPILLGQQLNIYQQQELKGIITYAKLDKQAEKKWLTLSQIIEFKDWNSGENFWIIDVLSPWGHGRQLCTDLENYLSKQGHQGKIIRYKRNYANGKVRFNQSII